MLYLVRHGDALSEDVDIKRSLSEKGINDVNKAAMLLKEIHPQVSIIIHSGKRRAEQTANLIYEKLELNCPIKSNKQLSPNDPIENIYSYIVNNKENIMIIGHLPFLSRLLSKLVTSREEETIVNFKTSTIAVLKYVLHQNWQVLQLISP